MIGPLRAVDDMAGKLHIGRPTPISIPWLTPLTPWEKFRRDPARFLARWLYIRQPTAQQFDTSTSSSSVAVVCISDTHCTEPDVPDGDILIHSGDLTNKGSFEELQKQLSWLNTLPHKHKIVIGGNHDSLLDPAYVARFPERIHEGEGTSRSDLNWGDITYLNNTSATVPLDNKRTLSVYGSPWTPEYGAFAFQYPPIRKVWADTVPNDTDILVTHGPPKGHLDLEGKGCPQLLKELKRVRPRLVVFGHIHAGRGRDVIRYDGIGNAYDRVMTGEAGLAAVVVMAILVAWSWLYSIPFGTSRRSSGKGVTILVNGAVVGGRYNEENHGGTSVMI